MENSFIGCGNARFNVITPGNKITKTGDVDSEETFELRADVAIREQDGKMFVHVSKKRTWKEDVEDPEDPELTVKENKEELTLDAFKLHAPMNDPDQLEAVIDALTEYLANLRA